MSYKAEILSDYLILIMCHQKDGSVTDYLFYSGKATGNMATTSNHYMLHPWFCPCLSVHISLENMLHPWLYPCLSVHISVAMMLHPGPSLVVCAYISWEYVTSLVVTKAVFTPHYMLHRPSTLFVCAYLPREPKRICYIPGCIFPCLCIYRSRLFYTPGPSLVVCAYIYWEYVTSLVVTNARCSVSKSH